MIALNKRTLTHWKHVKLGDVCKITYGKGLPTKHLKQSGYPVFGANGIIGYYDKYLYKEPEVLISCRGAYSGKINFSPPECFITNNSLVLLISESISLNKKYLYYTLNAVNRTKLITGSAQPQVTINNAVELDLPLPPLPTQLAIVSKIEELFSELDKGIEQLKTAQQQLKTYRQAVLKWAFEGKLTKQWRGSQAKLVSGDELLTKIKDEKERIAKINKKKVKPTPGISPGEINELFEIPIEWKWTTNEEYLFEVKDGTHDTPKYRKNGIPFITQKNIREDGLTFTDVQYISDEDHNKFYLRSNVSKGDILISMIGHNRGMTAIVETDRVFSIKNVGLFKLLPHLQLNKFSFYYYQSRVGLNIVLRKSKGGAQPFIGLTELRNWPVVVCSFEEQTQIVLEIESRLSVADKLEESINNSLQQAEALRQSILKKAFEGKLVES